MTITSQASAETDVVPPDSATTLEPVSPSLVFITEHEVVFGAAVAAALAPSATIHPHGQPNRLVAAIRHVRIVLPEPRPSYLRREASYFESARMSRLMDHL